MHVEENFTNYEKIGDEATAADDFPAKLDNHLNNIIVKEGYKTYNVEKKAISTNGGNYLGLLYEIDVTGETATGPKETNIFIKNTVASEENIKILSITKAYETELFAYKELDKVFHELQDEADVPEEFRFKMVKSFDESNSEAIILHNIARKGYKTTYRMDVVSLKYAEMAIRHLAKFHGLSFAIEKRRPHFFNENIKTMKTSLNFGEHWQGFMNAMRNLTINYLDDDMKEDMEKIFPRLLEKFSVYIQDASDVSCLCHGDFRPNNLMIKEENGDVIDLIPIDYQLMHYGCPAQDFIYFIFTSTDRQFRTEHFTHLKDLYYDTLGRFLEYFDINVEMVYPREEFEKMVKERLDYGLIVTLVFGPFFFVDEDDVPDVSKECMSSISFKLDDKFRKRLRDTIEEFVDLGYLKDY